MKTIHRFVFALISVSVLSTATLAQWDTALSIGDPAPPLEHVSWLKNGKAESFEPGTIYVLDFWATWCGPCIQSMPHLRSIQEQYEDENVKVVGIAIWPRGGSTTPRRFVMNPPEQAGKITWTVGKDIKGQTAEAYMDATDQTGIPTVMIVNGQGLLAWIGHPMELDEPLRMIVAGEDPYEAEESEMYDAYSDSDTPSDYRNFKALLATAPFFIAIAYFVMRRMLGD
ncbi:MAG: TlpA disulfide reductase family protein [Planctomycetota bacterium]